MKLLRLYEVTISPKFVTYAGTETYGVNVVEIVATDANQAIKIARRNRRDEDGRYTVPAAYRAKLVKLDYE